MTLITNDTRQADGLSGLTSSSSSTSSADASLWASQLKSAMADSESSSSSVLGAIGGTVASPSTAVVAQALAQEDDAAQQFLDFVSMDPSEQMRAQILGSMGITEEQLAAMSPEEQEKIEAKIREMIETKIKKDTEEKAAAAQQAQAEAQANPLGAAKAGETAETSDGSTADKPDSDPTRSNGATASEALLPFPVARAETEADAARTDTEKAREALRA